jgi:hypothetical protein
MKLSDHQVFMLRMFEKGWGFRLFNEKNGSWITFHSLKRKGLIKNGPTKIIKGKPVAFDRLTDKGREILMGVKNVCKQR